MMPWWALAVLLLGVNFAVWGAVGLVRLAESGARRSRHAVVRDGGLTVADVAVVIPAHNEALVIGESLRSIIALVPRQNVHVVSDGSTDATVAIARRAGARVIETDQNVGKAGALQEAIERFGLVRRFALVMLLDADTRAEFINRAFRDYFALPDDKADSKPPFIALMYHGRDTGAYEMPEDELSHFIAQRTRMIQAGDETPINIKLRDGQVLRFSCTVLPDGGRMLSYTPVTDLVRHTDDPAKLDYYQSLRGGGLRGNTPPLRAAE